ncbi:MAG: pre-toxin TG domain-containing protein [Minisyncoccia bacterium]
MEFKLEKPSLETENPNENRDKIMEKAQEERLKLKFDVFLKTVKLAIHFLEVTTPIGNFKMGAEAMLGKRFLTGEELSKKDRIMYGLIVLHSSIYATLLGYGLIKGDPNAIMLSAPVYAITVGLTIAGKRQQVKEDIPESVKKYGDSLNEQLIASKKAIEEYGQENVKKLIEKIKQNKKPDDNE